jgi:potassium-transporting ATPase KdpC subunit
MKNFIISIRMLLVMIVLTGIIYPLSMTLIGQVFFKGKVNGSIININGINAGSELIGQKFVSEKYFLGRPSAADYATVPSGASNLAPTSKTLVENIEKQKKLFGSPDIPSDLLFTSGSGLDPHISPEAAYFQMERVAKSRNFDITKREKLKKLVDQFIEKRDFLLLGEERVNVLMLNIALDKMDS